MFLATLVLLQQIGKLSKLKVKLVFPKATSSFLLLLYFEFPLTTEGVAGNDRVLFVYGIFNKS